MLTCSSHLRYALLVQLAFSLRLSTSVSGYCKPGFVANVTETGSLDQASCVCSGHMSAIVKCNLEDGKAEMANGYCMTFEFETNVTVVGKCPYNGNYSVTKHGSNALYRNLPDSVFELEEYLCGSFNREGLLCSVCKENFSLPLISYSMDCVQCDQSVVHYGWIVYFGVRIIPVTILYIVIIVFDIQLAKSPLNAYILYCQVVVNIINYNTQLYARLLALSNEFRVASVILKIGLSFYGFWNLDFFFLHFPTILHKYFSERAEQSYTPLCCCAVPTCSYFVFVLLYSPVHTKFQANCDSLEGHEGLPQFSALLLLSTNCTKDKLKGCR